MIKFLGYVQTQELHQKLETEGDYHLIYSYEIIGHSFKEKQEILKTVRTDNENQIGHNYRGAQALANIPSIHRNEFQIPQRVNQVSNFNNSMPEIQQINQDEILDNRSRLDVYHRRGNSNFQMQNNSNMGWKW